MDDLVQWLHAQINEDERIAREAGGAAWEELPVSGWVHTSALPDTEWQPPGYDHHVASAPLPVDRAHIVAHDPARVLREIDTKRKTVALCEPPLLDVTGPGDAEKSFVPGEGPPWGLDVLKLLALPYADRPGYQESWRP
ncbi:DUF6221 family protein [Streptomyces sp. NPDC058534]|uniref:DUF6221 family protein n=1 Tax=Streptomyces sp. NPDC058534 TaxID=3346541 RepID=UPI0036593DAC